jgi:3-keto-disaccharide hydrolase
VPTTTFLLRLGGFPGQIKPTAMKACPFRQVLKRITLLMGAAGLALIVCAPRASGAGLQPIFNGRDLSGWKAPDPNPFWRVEDGVLIGENDAKRKGNVLYTDQSYKDFILEADVRWSGEIDSGFMLRKPELQMQIGVSRSLKTDMTACFYTGGRDIYPMAGRAKNFKSTFKPGQWNTFRLEAKGDVFTVWVNGLKTTEYANPKYREASPIGLQIHPGLKMKVEFRNLRLERL